MKLEICVESLEAAQAAESGRADRIELCSALSEGGLTPSAGLIQTVCENIAIPAFVMIRPRSGDFFYSPEEFAVMKVDIAVARNCGAAGVVLGLLLKNGEVDLQRTRELVDLARPMEVTFHRALDRAPSLEEALEAVIATGADRVLTSGGTQTALAGMDTIARLVEVARERVSVMVCGHVRAENIGALIRGTKGREYHASLRKEFRSPVTYQNHGVSLGEPGRDEFARYTVSTQDVHELREAMLQAQSGE